MCYLDKSSEIQILNITIDVYSVIIFFLFLVLLLFWILLLIFSFNIIKNIKNKQKIKSTLENHKDLKKNIDNFTKELEKIKLKIIDKSD